jgi:hypothetical protein
MALFQERTVPHAGKLAGFAALIEALGVHAPLRLPSCVSDQHIGGSRREADTWLLFDKRYWPGDTLADQLIFALRHEPMDLLVLKRIFEAFPKNQLEDMIRMAPTGVHVRRAWFLYEALTTRVLDVQDAPRAAAVDILDPEEYFTAEPRLSKRHRVRDNLLGSGPFCPVIRRTPALKEFVQLDLSAKARTTLGRAGAHLAARAASFMLLADSRASFEIEGERPPRNRLERWGRAILQAGKNPLRVEEVVRLQRVLIEDPVYRSRNPPRGGVPGRPRPRRGAFARFYWRTARRSWGVAARLADCRQSHE